MIAKTFEVRDDGTFIPVMAIKLMPGSEAERYLLARAGYGNIPRRQAEYVVVVTLDPPLRAEYDPWEWNNGSRTMLNAHLWIRDHFDDLPSGSVVDVEYIMGITTAPKMPEAMEYG